MTRIYLITALAVLSACANTATGPSVILSERDDASSVAPPKRAGLCTEPRAGCIGGVFIPRFPPEEPKPCHPCDRGLFRKPSRPAPLKGTTE